MFGPLEHRLRCLGGLHIVRRDSGGGRRQGTLARLRLYCHWLGGYGARLRAELDGRRGLQAHNAEFGGRRFAG